LRAARESFAPAGAVGIVSRLLNVSIRRGPAAADRRRNGIPTNLTTLRRQASRAQRKLLASVGDDVLVGELARRLDRPPRGTSLLGDLVQRVHAKTAGALAERLTPTRRLDYSHHAIELVIGSPSVGKRLRSAAKEPFTVEWIERSIRPGDVFYDIGANVGAYSLIAAKSTSNRARVFAFEPSPASFHDLARNVLLNGCQPSIAPMPIALWSSTGLLSLTMSSAASGAACHRLNAEDRTDEACAETVIGVRLDDLVERFGLPIPTHAKIDVDGYELETLRGAERSLRRHGWRSIVIELDRDDTDRNRAIGDVLEDAGFGPGRALHYTRPGAHKHRYCLFERVAA
jgi:FkbM family methyltransferase